MNSPEESIVHQGNGARPDRARPIKPLPTDRLAIDTQFSVLRGYAATSGNDRRAVGNDDVAKTVGINANSVSLCNPFWESIGLIVRDGRKQRPADAVFDYLQAHQWNPDTAAAKLAPIISAAWFCAALIPKLTFRSLTRMEAVSFLAEEAKASPDYRDNLFLLLDYMKQAGIVTIENEAVTLIQNRPVVQPVPVADPVVPKDKGDEAKNAIPEIGTKRFAIHVPDKKDVVITLPEDIDQEDWEMVLDVIQRYVNRWKRFPAPKAGA